QTVLDRRRHRWADDALDQPGLLEVAQPLAEHAGRDPIHRLDELVEAQCAAQRGEDDRDEPAPLEEVRRAADLLGHWLTLTTARHRARAPARARAPHPPSSRGGSSSARAPRL